MPRVESTAPMSGAGAPRRAGQRKKPPPRQDRLSQRALLLRRLRRSLRPVIWLLGIGAVFVLGAELFRTIPEMAPLPAAPAGSAPAPAAAAAPPRHGRFGPAGLLADLGLRITSIEVHGASSLDPAALAAAIGVKPGDPAFGFSLAAMQARIAALGPVRSVTVERILPGKLVIDVTARDPLAIWQTGRNTEPRFVLLDKDGNVITDQDAAAAKRREPSLLLLSGAGAPQYAPALLAALKAQPAVLAYVTAAQRVDGLRWNLILKDHTVVKLPGQNEAGALTELAALQSSMQLLERPVEDIDLRQPGRLIVRPYPAADDKDTKPKQDAEPGAKP